MSQESMSVLECCSEEEKKTILERWKKDGANSDFLISVEDQLGSECSKWFAVYSEDKSPLGIFDVRKVPAHAPIYHKSLRVYFAPKIGIILDNGVDFDVIEEAISIAGYVLAHAFSSLMKQAEESQDGLCKIYCEHPFVSIIYRSFFNYLVENYPDKYEGKLYKNWLEIKKK